MLRREVLALHRQRCILFAADRLWQNHITRRYKSIWWHPQFNSFFCICKWFYFTGYQTHSGRRSPGIARWCRCMTAPKGFLPCTPGKYGNRIYTPSKMGIRCGSSGRGRCVCAVVFVYNCFSATSVACFMFLVVCGLKWYRFHKSQLAAFGLKF